MDVPSFDAQNLFNSQSPLPDPTTAREVLNYKELYDRAKLNSLKQNINERKKYADNIFRLLCYWLGAIMIVILLSGINDVNLEFTTKHKLLFKFQLSETVLITLITTTTINVAGFFLVVIKYLFPVSESLSQNLE